MVPSAGRGGCPYLNGLVFTGKRRFTGVNGRTASDVRPTTVHEPGSGTPVKLVNRTKICVERVVTMDGSGREVLLVLAKATYDARWPQPRLAGEQVPIQMADEYEGEPGESCLRHASDLALFKPAADVILLGQARPRRRGDTRLDVTLRVGSLAKTVRVTGDRRFARTLLGYRLTRPAPIEQVPLTFARTFGGRDASTGKPAQCAENPVGTGFRVRRSKADLAGVPAPNLEYPGQGLRRPGTKGRPAAFGCVAPNWRPRLDHAGTYDDAWLERRMPLLPDDFDPRFNQTAPADQILAGYLQGGERVRVTGVSAAGDLSFTLPRERPEAVARLGQQRLAVDLNCDTLVIDADRVLFTMLWRGTLAVQGRLDELQWVKVTHPLGALDEH